MTLVYLYFKQNVKKKEKTKNLIKSVKSTINTHSLQDDRNVNHLTCLVYLDA